VNNEVERKMSNRRSIAAANFFLLIFFFGCGAVSAEGSLCKEAEFAGSFYPGSNVKLASMVDGFIKAARVPETEGKIFAIIAPHAGYVYSGGVAGYSFKAIQGKPFETVIIIGPTHRYHFNGVSVYGKGFFSTPLGRVEIDSEVAAALINSSERISFKKEVFAGEHSVEVEIPFLQRALKDFKIVPVIMGRLTYENCEALGRALAGVIGEDERILVVASTDMSHYKSYRQALQMDRFTISLLTRLKPRLLFDHIQRGVSELCGAGPVLSTLIAANELNINKIRVLKYANSGDVTGDKQRVVGYMAAVLYRTGAKVQRHKGTKEGEEEGGEGMLDEKQKKRLLNIARESIGFYLSKSEQKEFTETEPVLLEKNGVFVTLKKKGELRGCIGCYTPTTKPLYETVADMAISAATQDPRFPKVTPEELEEIKIEISVLSELEKIDDVNKIETGKHGVVVRKGFRGGVFLPQVATETGWDREEFLSKLCAHKAGLSPDAWKDKDTQIYIFTVQKFEEE